ncbi:hypothetical protein [Micromonospora sp. NPDC047134]|uniref:hypothetical protein n=1 Tax=Micromonospora sp. NPDC047134 TaxID=3154340 RepID=UPI00340A75CE
MRIIEGTVEEIIEYQRRGGAEPEPVDDPSGAAPEVEPETAVSTSVLGLDDEDSFAILQFVYTRARDGATTRRVLAFLNRVLEQGTMIEMGQSNRSYDGYTQYLMVRDDGPRRFGAVAYIKPANGGLTLRLRPEDVADIADERVTLRRVVSTDPYGINCQLVDDEAVELASQLTERALAKIR